MALLPLLHLLVIIQLHHPLLLVTLPLHYHHRVQVTIMDLLFPLHLLILLLPHLVLDQAALVMMIMVLLLLLLYPQSTLHHLLHHHQATLLQLPQTVSSVLRLT